MREIDATLARREALSWYSLPRAVFSGGNDVELLRGGDALFPAMHRAIAQATRDIWLATYIFHDDEAALGLADALVAAAARGVRVRVVIDGFGSGQSLATVHARLSKGGVAVAVFRPVQGWWSWLLPGQLRRLHQKLCVVDGREAFVGGINLIDDRLDLHHGWQATPRLDYAVRLLGAVVRPVEQTARAMWTRAWLGRDWRDEIAALARRPHRLLRARKLLRRLRTSKWAELPAGSADSNPVRVAFVVRDNLRQRRTIERSYVDAIHAARESVDIVCPYFYPGHAFRRALREAARRGVRVRLLLQGRWDYRMAELAAHALYEELLGRGVYIHEYQPAYLHAKVAVVDADWATVGSSNIDPLSLLVNLEANVVVRDRAFTADLRAEIEAALADARRITAADGESGRFGLLRRALVAWCARVYLRVAGASGQY
ncbi:MAG TPA: cardiolipin synthase ClsB [Methylibium sp.]